LVLFFKKEHSFFVFFDRSFLIYSPEKRKKINHEDTKRTKNFTKRSAASCFAREGFIVYSSSNPPKIQTALIFAIRHETRVVHIFLSSS